MATARKPAAAAVPVPESVPDPPVVEVPGKSAVAPVASSEPREAEVELTEPEPATPVDDGIRRLPYYVAALEARRLNQEAQAQRGRG